MHLPIESMGFSLSHNIFDILRHLPEGVRWYLPAITNTDHFIRDLHLPNGERVQQHNLSHLSLLFPTHQLEEDFDFLLTDEQRLVLIDQIGKIREANRMSNNKHFFVSSDEESEEEVHSETEEDSEVNSRWQVARDEESFIHSTMIILEDLNKKGNSVTLV